MDLNYKSYQLELLLPLLDFYKLQHSQCACIQPEQQWPHIKISYLSRIRKNGNNTNICQKFKKVILKLKKNKNLSLTQSYKIKF